MTGEKKAWPGRSCVNCGSPIYFSQQVLGIRFSVGSFKRHVEGFKEYLGVGTDLFCMPCIDKVGHDAIWDAIRNVIKVGSASEVDVEATP